MKVIRFKEVFYPHFLIGGRPVAVNADIAIVECNDGQRYLRTPFAFLPSKHDDDIERQIDERRYYATEEACQAFLDRQYPNWQLAEPIMNAWANNGRYHGSMLAYCNTARAIGVSIHTQELSNIARGHKSVSVKEIKRCLKALTLESAGR